MTIDLDTLETLAKEATSGPWKYDLRVGRNAVYTENNNPNCLSDVSDSDHICDMHGIYFDGKWNMTEQQDNNCKYIAAVNPTVVLELIKELRHEREKYKYATIRYQEECDVRDWLAQHFGKLRKCKTCKELPDDIVTVNDCIQCVVEYARENIGGKYD